MKENAVKFSVNGSFAGHNARRCFRFLQVISSYRERKIILDLRDCTSVDSFGRGVLDWINSRNTQAFIEVLEPDAGFDCSIAPIKLTDSNN